MEISQLPQAVEQTITVLANKLSVPAEKLVEIGVIEVRIEGVVYSCMFLVLIIISLMVCKKLYSICKTCSDEEGKISIGAITCFLIVIDIALFVALSQRIIQSIIPEYTLLKTILTSI